MAVAVCIEDDVEAGDAVLGSELDDLLGRAVTVGVAVKRTVGGRAVCGVGPGDLDS